MSLHMGGPTWQQFRFSPRPSWGYIPWQGRQGPAVSGWSVFGHWGTNFWWICWRYIGAKHQEDGFWIWKPETGVGKTLSVFNSVFPGHFCSMYSLGWISVTGTKKCMELWRDQLTRSPQGKFCPLKSGAPKRKPDTYEPTNQPFSGANLFFFVSGRVWYPWNKSLNGLFSLLNNVIPKSLKFGHWPSICFWFGSVRKTTSFSPHVTGFRTPMHPGVHQRLSRCRIFKVNQQNVSIFPRLLDVQIDESIAAVFPTTRGPVGI